MSERQIYTVRIGRVESCWVEFDCQVAATSPEEACEAAREGRILARGEDRCCAVESVGHHNVMSDPVPEPALRVEDFKRASEEDD